MRHLAVAIAVAFSAVTIPAYADESLKEHCQLLADLSNGMALDRDSGISYQARQQHNINVSKSEQVSEKWLHDMTKGVYVNFKKYPPQTIAGLTFLACLQGE